MNEMMGFGQPTCSPMMDCRTPTVTERLTEHKVKLETELARVNEALRLLESQPGVTEVLNALAKLGVR